MIQVPVSEVIEGDRLSQSVYRPDGQLVLSSGSLLNRSLIEGLSRLQVEQVYVENHRSAEAELSGDKAKPFKQLAMRLVGDLFRDVLQYRTLKSQEVLQAAEQLTSLIDVYADIEFGSKEFRHPDTYLMAHSVNVGLLSMLMGKALGYNSQQLRTLAIGALLHDVGYLVKDAGTADTEHPRIGFELLRRHADIPLLSAYIVLQHHEQVNGTGYPLAIRGDAFRQSSQICALANDFDSYLNEIGTNRSRHEGIEHILSKVELAYDYEVVRAFIQVVVPYPTGTFVLLTNGATGQVVANNSGHPSRPVIELINGRQRLNLLDHPSIFITEVLLEQQVCPNN